MVGGQGGLVVKRPPGNQKVGGSNPTTATWYVAQTKNGHWDSPLHRRCPNGPPEPEWKTS